MFCFQLEECLRDKVTDIYIYIYIGNMVVCKRFSVISINYECVSICIYIVYI